MPGTRYHQPVTDEEVADALIAFTQSVLDDEPRAERDHESSLTGGVRQSRLLLDSPGIPPGLESSELPPVITTPTATTAAGIRNPTPQTPKSNHAPADAAAGPSPAGGTAEEPTVPGPHRRTPDSAAARSYSARDSAVTAVATVLCR
ncbi:hypothetical protein [Nocardia sp. N2S4-5]|uniref:hypothetical protein n=1 Tax=Nocardia sp. N2S4-5 TaxID=3351565 RepID=UPI0037D07E98